MKKNIFIAVSDVAAAIGKNRYKTPKEVAQRILDNQFPEIKCDLAPKQQASKVVKQALKEKALMIMELATSKTESKEKRQKVISQNLPVAVKSVIQTIETETPCSAFGMSSKLPLSVEIEHVQIKIQEAEMAEEDTNSLEQELKVLSSFSQTLHKQVHKEVEAEVSRATGTIREEEIVNQVEKDMKRKVVERNCTMKYWRFDLPGYESKYRISIGGKPDGLTIDPFTKQVTVVEVKNRQNRLFGSVPEYERIQVQLYMSLFNAKSCHFTENYYDDSESYTILFKATEIALIQEAIVDFVKSELLSKLEKNFVLPLVVAGTTQISWDLFQSGQDIDQISEQRSFKRRTIFDHITKALEILGVPADFDWKRLDYDPIVESELLSHLGNKEAMIQKCTELGIGRYEHKVLVVELRQKLGALSKSSKTR